MKQTAIISKKGGEEEGQEEIYAPKRKSDSAPDPYTVEEDSLPRLPLGHTLHPMIYKPSTFHRQKIQRIEKTSRKQGTSAYSQPSEFLNVTSQFLVPRTRTLE